MVPRSVRAEVLHPLHDLNKAKEEEGDYGAFEGEISDDTTPWGCVDDDSDNSLSPDEDEKDASGIYNSSDTHRRIAQTPSAPVITYELNLSSGSL